MNKTHLLALAAALVAAPLAYAHTDGTSGYPKPYCEDVKGDTETHDYGAPSTGLLLFDPFDGSIGPCPYDEQWDGHSEFAVGGARLLACEFYCGSIAGYDNGAATCWGTYADHDEFPRVSVFDDALTTSGVPVTFTVSADHYINIPPIDPRYDPCGDYEDDMSFDCVDTCTVPFGAGLDGSYRVYVLGTSGHISTT